jgi:RNA polymerase sigma factor (sigma-70 family)
MTDLVQNTFDEIHAQYRHRVHARAYKILKDVNESDDVCQEVFRKLFPRYKTMSNDHMKKWILVVTKNTALKIHAKNKRMTCVEFLEEEDTSTLYTSKNIAHVDNTHRLDLPKSLDLNTPISNMLAAEQKDETHEILREAFDTLPKRLQEILRLRYYQELSYSQIAEKLKLTQGNVGFLINRAMHKLRNAFAWQKAQVVKD